MFILKKIQRAVDLDCSLTFQYPAEKEKLFMAVKTLKSIVDDAKQIQEHRRKTSKTFWRLCQVELAALY